MQEIASTWASVKHLMWYCREEVEQGVGLEGMEEPEQGK